MAKRRGGLGYDDGPDFAASVFHSSRRSENQLDSDQGRKNSKTMKVLLTIAILLLLAAAGLFVFLRLRDRSPLPSGLIKELTYSVYYPVSIPQGYYLDKSSVKTNDSILFYTFVTESANTPITVTSQAIPTGFNAQAIIGQTSIPAVSLTIGVIYDISTSQESKYMLPAGDTLMFINSPAKVSNDLVLTLARSFHKVN
jgi:hypothetical protein